MMDRRQLKLLVVEHIEYSGYRNPGIQAINP